MWEELAAVLLKLVEAGPEVFNTVSKLEPIAVDIIEKIKGPVPTDEEWTALHDKIDAAREELDAPIPPEDLP